jgi:hypothetical protein
LSQGASWFPAWALWILLPWLALHLYYDFSISKDLRKQGKPRERKKGLSGFLGYAQIMEENTRRYERGDPMARLVTYYDWVIVAGFVLLLGRRLLFS